MTHSEVLKLELRANIQVLICPATDWDSLHLTSGSRMAMLPCVRAMFSQVRWHHCYGNRRVEKSYPYKS